MNKKVYIAPNSDVQEINIECMLSLSASGSLNGTGMGGNGSGMDADTNVRNEWDQGLW